MREFINEQEDDEAMGKASRKGNFLLLLSVLAALNFAVVMVVSQLPITSPGIEKVVQQAGAQIRPVYLVQGSEQSNYSFQSCTGGDSVNCHRNGNLAGL